MPTFPPSNGCLQSEKGRATLVKHACNVTIATTGWVGGVKAVSYRWHGAATRHVLAGLAAATDTYSAVTHGPSL